MRVILCFALFSAVRPWAGEVPDRTAIVGIITALNDPIHLAALFTKDADSDVDFDRLVELHRIGPRPPGAVLGMNEPWTQLTTPRIASGPIRFITPDVAIVDAESRIDGAVTLARSVPLLFVLKKEGANWRISAVRVVRVRPSPLPRII